MNITHMSVSRKSVWDECKKKYHFKYHLKVESEEPEPCVTAPFKRLRTMLTCLTQMLGNRLGRLSFI